MQVPGEPAVTRRSVMAGAAACAATVSAPPAAGAQATAAAGPAASTRAPVTSKVAFAVNGEGRTLELDTRTTLLDALREHLRLSGHAMPHRRRG